MKKYILYSSYIAAIIGAFSGFIEFLRFILKGNNIINRSHLFWILFFYAFIWAIFGLVLGFLMFLITLIRKFSLTQEKIVPFFTSTISFFILTILLGFNINYEKYINKKLFTNKSILLNFIFVLGVFALCLIIYKGFIYLKKRKTFIQFCKIINSKKIKLSLVLAIIIIIFIISFYPTQKINKKYVDSEIKKEPTVNCVFILIDALRADHLSCYGYDRKTTPYIDKLAHEGVIFTNAFSNAGWTKPTTITIFSSLHAISHNTYNIAAIIPNNITILPEILKQKGYSTAIFSANNLVSPIFGFNKGTDYFYAYQPSIFRQFTLGFIINYFAARYTIIQKPYFLLKKIEQLTLYRKVLDISAEGINNAFINWLDHLDGKCFFAFLHYMDVHAPYTLNSPYDKMFVSSGLSNKLKNIEANKTLETKTIESIFNHLPENMNLEEKKEYIISQYDGSIRLMDNYVGKLVKELQKRNILDKTLFIITADHGDEFYEHGEWGHGWHRYPYEELIHIPLILRYPQKLPQGKVIDELVSQIDFMPTILDISGIPIKNNKEIQGLSLLNIINEKDERFRNRFILSETYLTPNNNFIRTIRNQESKLIVCKTDYNLELFLYDLINDPEEKINIVNKNLQQRTLLLQQLENYVNKLPRYGSSAKKAMIDEETKQRLKALGYIN